MSCRRLPGKSVAAATLAVELSLTTRQFVALGPRQRWGGDPDARTNPLQCCVALLGDLPTNRLRIEVQHQPMTGVIGVGCARDRASSGPAGRCEQAQD
jgi:hypothetical protein